MGIEDEVKQMRPADRYVQAAAGAIHQKLEEDGRWGVMVIAIDMTKITEEGALPVGYTLASMGSRGISPEGMLVALEATATAIKMKITQ